MLDSPIVDVAMGLVFFYVTLSLVCSSIQEIIASLLGLRSRNLKKGIRNLIGNEYAEAVYDHPLIKGLRKPKKLPSYIKPEIFSTALIDMISRDKTEENAIDAAAEDVRALIAKIDANNPTRELLISLVDKANPTVEDLRERLADWFDAGMDRVAGWYKRQVKYCLVGVAAVVTVAVNADRFAWSSSFGSTTRCAARSPPRPSRRPRTETFPRSTSEPRSGHSRSAMPTPFRTSAFGRSSAGSLPWRRSAWARRSGSIS